MIHHIRETSDLNKLVDAKDVTLVYYTATWCKPCARISPMFESLPQRRIKVDVDRCQDTVVVNQGITSIPTLQVWKAGKLLETVSLENSDHLKLVSTRHS